MMLYGSLYHRGNLFSLWLSIFLDQLVSLWWVSDFYTVELRYQWKGNSNDTPKRIMSYKNTHKGFLGITKPQSICPMRHSRMYNTNKITISWFEFILGHFAKPGHVALAVFSIGLPQNQIISEVLTQISMASVHILHYFANSCTGMVIKGAFPTNHWWYYQYLRHLRKSNLCPL